NFREMTEADYIFKATVGSQRAIKYTSKNAVLKGIKYDDSITLVDGMGMAVSDDLDRIRVRLGQVAPGEYGMTLYNKAGDPTLWLDADTGDAVLSGRLQASVIEGGTINGSVIRGSSIYGGTISTNEDGYPNITMSETLNLIVAEYSHTRKISIDPNNYLTNQYPHLKWESDGYEAHIHHGGASGLQFDANDFVFNADLSMDGGASIW